MSTSSIYINNGVVYLTADDNNLYTNDIIQQVNTAMLNGWWVHEFPANFELQEVGTYSIYQYVNGYNYTDDTTINYNPPFNIKPYDYPKNNNKNPNEETKETNNDIIVYVLGGALLAYSFYVINKNK